MLVAELDVSVGRGLRPGLGLFARIPVRVVRDRVRYEDLSRLPYEPPNPGRHHRNETLSGLADPQIYLHAGREAGAWQLGAKAGVSIPLGATEPNPFALGRLGQTHQHVQFGTGTWDPVFEAGVGHPLGPLHLRVTGIARLAFSQNEHGYEAGDRFAVLVDASHWPGQTWGFDTGLGLLREEAERWDGHIEHEGNLGRTDVLLSLGVTRAATSIGTIHGGVQISLHSHTHGEQMEIPLIVRFGWSP